MSRRVQEPRANDDALKSSFLVGFQTRRDVSIRPSNESNPTSVILLTRKETYKEKASNFFSLHGRSCFPFLSHSPISASFKMIPSRASAVESDFFLPSLSHSFASPNGFFPAKKDVRRSSSSNLKEKRISPRRGTTAFFTTAYTERSFFSVHGIRNQIGRDEFSDISPRRSLGHFGFRRTIFFHIPLLSLSLSNVFFVICPRNLINILHPNGSF